MAGHGQKLSRKREQAIAALLAAPTVKKAAARAGVSERTLQLWLADPDFREAFRAARRRVLEGAVANLQHASRAAVATLRRNLRCGAAAVEVRAAVAILEQ